MIDGHELCRGELDVIARRVKQLEEIISKFATHQSWCDVNTDFVSGPICDCELYEALIAVGLEDIP